MTASRPIDHDRQQHAAEHANGSDVSDAQSCSDTQSPPPVDAVTEVPSAGRGMLERAYRCVNADRPSKTPAAIDVIALSLSFLLTAYRPLAHDTHSHAQEHANASDFTDAQSCRDTPFPLPPSCHPHTPQSPRPPSQPGPSSSPIL